MAKIESNVELPQSQNVDMTAILARLNTLEKQNAVLTAQVNPENALKKAKEKYQWPWAYSYKMWGEVPVVSYKSTKKDATKDYTYRWPLGDILSNQLLVLTLADGNEVKVDAVEFGRYFTTSERILAQPIKNGTPFVEETDRKADSYQFEHPTYGTFIITSNLIN